MNASTIVAIATPPGYGGVAIVRLSGTQALPIAKKITQKDLIPKRQACYTSFFSITNELLDQGLCLYFPGPNSYTGEDVVEFQVHGSPVMIDELIKNCLSLGAKPAKPGEFTERAFLNDKIDLTQAEAIADLIHASSVTAGKMALRTLQGEFANQVNQLNEELIRLRMYVEAAIDFPEEEIDFLGDGKIETLLRGILLRLNEIKSQAFQGALLREGITLVIAGVPNVGKSTLINHLAGKEVAIVTDIPGTTRDVMREQILLDNIPVHVVDTAGLRETNDLVEKEGIKRAWRELHNADCVLLLADLQNAQSGVDLETQIKKALPTQVPIIRVFNKIDLHQESPRTEGETVYLSAKTGAGIDLLISKIKDIIGYRPAEGHFLARRRHIHALETATDYLNGGLNQLIHHKAGELLAEDLRQAHLCLGEITGEFSSDDLLGKIFSSFCIGK